MRMQRVPGHSIDSLATPRDDDGNPVPPVRVGRFRKAIGRGKCSCGLLSPVLDSGPDRQEWHRGHKLDVLTEAVLGVPLPSLASLEDAANTA
jgi:hypothetical protein